MPKIIKETYAMLGREILGARHDKPWTKSNPEKDNSKLAPESSTKKKWDTKKKKKKGKIEGWSLQQEATEKRYNLRKRDNIRPPDKCKDTETRSSRSFQEASKKCLERGRQ